MQFPSNDVFTRVCHVKTHLDREQHVTSEFGRRGVPVHFFLDFDIPDLTDIHYRQFPTTLTPAAFSLTLKHIHIWKAFIASDLPYCLIFEDDVLLNPDFNSRLADCIAELGDPQRAAVVYLGNGGNYYTAQSKLEPGRNLYPGPHSRCTDAYLITRSAASARCKWFHENRLVRPVDHLVNVADREAGVEVLWFERPVVEQGTHTGLFQSTISSKRRPLWLRRIEWQLKKARRMKKGHSTSGS